MIVFRAPQEMQAWSQATRCRRESIALVPTMGALHEGHCSLLRKAREVADHVIMSLFINPAQFGPNEDIGKYPRDSEGDAKKARACGVDIVFSPAPEAMYAKEFQTWCAPGNLSRPLCGRSRPDHFRGVATVVLKLFNLTLPHRAVFGLKDYQQFKIIERMVRDLNLPVELVPMPIVREADGLAMSSRNRTLSPAERQAARRIPQALEIARRMVAEGRRDVVEIKNVVQAHLAESPINRIDYVSLCDPETLEEPERWREDPLLAVACFVGKTRLIDNTLLREER